MAPTNTYCEVLEISVPSLETAKRSRDANTYSLLITALLERGGPITLREAAERFEQAGIAPAERALLSLQRCQPARAPIYRDGDLYALDPHDHEADLWAFRLGLRPSKAAMRRPAPPDPKPLPALDQPLTATALDEAWREGIPNQWSAQRIAACVLDAHTDPMSAAQVIAFVDLRSPQHRLTPNAAEYWREGAAIRVRDDGLWELDRGHDAVRSARQAIRERIDIIRRWAHLRPDPKVQEANRSHSERLRQEHAKQLARMSRVILHSFPAQSPEALVLLDVERHEISTFVGEEITAATARLTDYDIIAAVEVRSLLRTLGVDRSGCRLEELGPPQKTRQLDRRGRKLSISTTLLIQGSCNISRPFGDERILRTHLQQGQLRKLRRRLEADAMSLFALYRYGRLHGTVRLRWGYLDERIRAPWVHPDEETLYGLKQRALELQWPLDVVVGSAPSWAEPWSRARRALAVRDEHRWQTWLFDEQGDWIDEAEVQLARLAVADCGGTRAR